METNIMSGNISRAEFIKRTNELQPDIIHIHGCWSVKAATVELWALHRNIPVVLSPHNGLSQREIQTDFWKKKLPCIITYQFLAIRKAMVLHVTSSQELEDIKQLGWKKRIALIPEPNGEEDDEQIVETFRALYQKVIDTAQRNKLSCHEKACIWALLHASVSIRHIQWLKTEEPDLSEKQFECVPSFTPETLEMLQKLSTHNWKNIQIYAIDHGIKEPVLLGTKTLALQIPVTIDRLPARFKTKSTIVPYTTSDKEQKILKEYDSDNNAIALATDMLYLHKMLCKNQYDKNWQSPGILLLSIYEHLMYTTYNEEIFCSIIKRLDITEFCSCIMQILAEKLQLSIGFMPLDPMSGKATKMLYKKFNDFNIPIKTT
ncbi:glycosyltransferase [Palleniella muris]|uniref:glycosyltransferase n=1 Tax=Palleniella muris TaxID=3038145 RepID=UPI001441313D|nr:glycosyltransferase [Palleniella muris]